MKQRIFAMSLAVTAAAWVVGAGAQQGEPEPTPPASYQEQVQRFFAHVTAGEYPEAIDDLYRDNPWIKAKLDEVNTMKGQFGTLPELAGELHGFDLVIEQKLSERFVYLWYVAAYERSPISFHFKFYKPGDRWMVFSFHYKEDLPQLAEELAKMELLFPERRSGEGSTLHQTLDTGRPGS